MPSYFESAVAVVERPMPTLGRGRRFWRQEEPVLMNGRVVRGGLFPHQKAWWDLDHFVRVLVAGYGGGKCVCKGTEVYDPVAGQRRKVEELGRLSCVSLNIQKELVARAAEAVSSGLKECVRLVLMDGSRLALSEDHRVLTARGWVEAKDLGPADAVVVPRLLPPAVNPVEAGDLVIAFIAYMMADGSTAHNASIFYKADREILEDFERVVSLVGGEYTENPLDRGCHRVNVRGLLPLLREYGVAGKKSKHKRLPSAWYGMSKAQAVVFLRAFLACDAYFSPRKMELTLASPGLIRDVRHLLLLLGITSRLGSPRWIRLGGRRYRAYRLSVYGEGYRTLLDCLGHVPGRRVQIEKARLYFQGRGKANPNADLVPFTKQDLGWICPRVGVRRTDADAFLGGRYGSRYGRALFGRFLDRFDVQDRELRRFVEGDVSWVRVKAVVPIGVREVYDLSVNDSSHNFVANQVVVHNTMVGCKRAISNALTNAPCATAVVSPTYPLARKTVIPTIHDLLSGKRTFYGRALWFRFNKTTHEFRIRFRGREALIMVLSGEDPTSLRGPNLATALIDEPFIQEEEVFHQMVARVRHPDASRLEINLTGTPEGISSWGYDLCKGELRSRIDVGLIQASTRANLAINPEYVKRLEGVFSKKAAQAYVEGEFVSLAEGLVYYGFDAFRYPDGNVLKWPMPEGAELGCGMDFNVNPFAFVVFWKYGNHLHYLKEYELPNADTEFACETLRDDWGSKLTDVYPDATGTARKTSSPTGKTDFHYIRQAGYQIRANHENPKRKDRYNAVNGKLAPKAGGRTITVDPEGCPHLVKYFSTYSYEKMNKQEGMSHLLDAATYPVAYLFPVNAETVQLGRLSGT